MDLQVREQTVSADELEGVARETAALTAALRRARRVRVVLVLAVVAFVVVIGFVLVQKLNQLTSAKNLEQLSDEARKAFERREDFYRNQVQTLINGVRPPLTEAFTEQAKKDMPQLKEALDKERPLLIDSLHKKFSAMLTKHYETLPQKYDKLLEEEFPQAKDEKLRAKMVGNVSKVVQNLLQTYYVDDMRHELEALFDNWDNFPAAQAPQKGKESLEDQFTGSLLDLLGHRLANRR